MLSQRTFPQGEDGIDDFLFTEKNSLASYGYNIQNSQNMDKQKIHYCFTLSDVQMEYYDKHIIMQSWRQSYVDSQRITHFTSRFNFT